MLLRLLSVLLGGVALREHLKDKCRRRPEPRPRRPKSRADCQPVSRFVYRRPDPLIYDQYYLMGLGLPVTWDNPDIRIERGGAPVDPHALDPATEYEIVARVWNGSQNAPAVGLPVRFSYLSFGIGTESHPIGTTVVDLGVKGSPGAPAFAHQSWTTPPAPGHYCLQVVLDWFDDANPLNNLGQTNTDVQTLNSPQAAFRFPVHNGGRKPRHVRLEADGYALPPRDPCPYEPAESADMSDEERDTRLRRAIATHAGLGEIPEGWRLHLEPEEFSLNPGETRDVSVEAIAPDGFDGRVAFNVNAFDGALLLGGVTLYAEGRA
jgi:hypothetical protein